MGADSVWLALPLALIASTSILAALVRYPNMLRDVPNERSLHEQPVPRTGGIAIVLAALGAWALMIPAGRLLVLLAATMALVSALDDWKGLSPFPRFSAHIAAAAVFSYFGLAQPSWPECLFLVLAIVWMTNLYNFMDGSDGLAGGMAVIGFGTYALAAWIAGHPLLSLISASIAAATLPFLAYNFFPARLFMGDTGSITLGFLVATIGALGWREGVWSPFFPVFAFSPFIADASLTLLRRLLARTRFWQPHRDHYYQKLIRMGLGHRRTAVAEYALMLLSGLGALATLRLDGQSQLALILVWGAILIALAARIDIAWQRYLRGGTE